MSRLSSFRYPWPARSTSSESFDEEKHVSKDIPTIPTIIITPPPSLDLAAGNHALSAESIFAPDPFYLQPPLHPHLRLYDYLRKSQHPALERRQQKGLRWTLIAMFLLLLISSSLHGVYITNASDARASDDSEDGLVYQEPDEGTAWDPHPLGGDSPIVSFRFELPRFLEWLAADPDVFGRPTPKDDHGSDTPGTRRVSILGVIGVGWRPRDDGDAWYKLGTVGGVVDLRMEQ
jgi:hypothetical protein